MLSAFYAPMTAGSEVFTEEISKRLAGDGHEVDVVTGSWMELPRKETINGVTVHRVPSVRLRYLALPSVFPGILLKGLSVSGDCDIIHAHLAFPPGFAGAKISSMTGTPLVTTVQGGDMGIYPESGLGRFFPLVRPLISWALKSSDRVTAISNFLKKKAESLGAEDVALVRNGTDIKLFNPRGSTKKVKKKYGITGSSVLLTASRLVPKNGVDVLISAFRRISREFPDAQLVIAGDGPERAALKRQASGLPVKFLGYAPREDLPALMNSADAFARLSLEEGLGIVFAEAMACKTPVLGTDVGGIPDMVEDGKTGLLVPPGDAEAAAQALERLLSDARLRKKLAENGHKRVKGEFSWESIYKRMLEVYGGVLE